MKNVETAIEYLHSLAKFVAKDWSPYMPVRIIIKGTKDSIEIEILSGLEVKDSNWGFERTCINRLDFLKPSASIDECKRVIGEAYEALEEISTKDKIGRGFELYKLLRSKVSCELTLKDLLIELLTNDDWDINQHQVENNTPKEESFFYDISLGSGFTGYLQLTEEQLVREICERDEVLAMLGLEADELLVFLE